MQDMKISEEELNSLEQMLIADEQSFELAKGLIENRWRNSSALLVRLQRILSSHSPRITTMKHEYGTRWCAIYMIAADIWSR